MNELWNTRNVEDAYIAEDGLLHCSRCGGPLEVRLPEYNKFFKSDKRPSTCKCREERIIRERKAHELREHKELVERNKGICFTDRRMWDWTFDNDDGSVPQMQMARRYVENWDKVRAEHIGLLLWGNLGSGKTYMAACIANALLEQEKKVLMTDFARISNISKFDAEEYVRSLDSYALLIIDDLGAEQDSDFALQNICNVINRRWNSGKPLIVTTNLELSSLKNVNEQELMFARISDRILDMCRPIHMETVESKRVASGKHKNQILKEIFEKEE
ncbi:MAG: ATP-binding protein [Lachnospiraceae bacterium]|nr:ATP-binding protein [Lachnospiraceae bacterium]